MIIGIQYIVYSDTIGAILVWDTQKEFFFIYKFYESNESDVSNKLNSESNKLDRVK